ncbi:MAG: DHH family phosphoesterase [Planctomycetes bacterium]|nr:DHH family phosphoesterase [Planctomycetota bacterium]MCC7170882.1 DHH family phosphoesterase [Planctomycetota bacterium]
MTASLTESIAQFERLVAQRSRFVLAGHVNIDGDSLGSMLGMADALRQLGKSVRCIVFEPVSDRYAFLQGAAKVEIFDPVVHAPALHDADVFMMFDFSSTNRIPGLWDLVEASRVTKVCFDHHPTATLPGDINVHDPASPATGTIVLAVLRRLGVPLSNSIAEALLVAISTDTGWFRYSNTSPAVLRDAAELTATGIDPHRIYREVYQRNEVALIRLIGAVAAQLNDEFDGRLLWATIPNELIERLGVGTFETDQLLDLLRTGRDVECVALMRETSNHDVRVNLRSRGVVDLTPIAREMGGGGHRHAAGATLQCGLTEAVDRVMPLVRAALAAGLRGLASTPR